MLAVEKVIAFRIIFRIIKNQKRYFMLMLITTKDLLLWKEWHISFNDVPFMHGFQMDKQPAVYTESMLWRILWIIARWCKKKKKKNRKKKKKNKRYNKEKETK